MERRSFLIAGTAMAMLGGSASAGADERYSFDSIDGGILDLRTFRGGPVLVVNTASRCGYTGQYDGLQALWDRYRDRGLTVVGIPSDSFRQELRSAEAVKDFCEVNFAIDFPMSDIVAVTGPSAHPFYRWAASEGVAPGWNFHKILLDPQGEIVQDFPTRMAPDAPDLVASIEALLPPS